LVFRLLAFDMLDGHDAFQAGTGLFQGAAGLCTPCPEALAIEGGGRGQGLVVF